MIFSYLKLAASLAALLFAGFVGFSFERSKFDQYKAEQTIVTQRLKDQHQATADRIEKVKNDQISDINSKLAAALVSLRQRPARPQIETPSASACGSGSTLYAEDAIFLIGEATRADTLRIALQSCYDQYDSLER